MEFQVRYLVLFLLFSVIDSFELFWVEILHKNIQLMLEFLKALFNDVLDNVICNIVVKGSKIEKMFIKFYNIDFNIGKTQLILFDPSNNNGYIDMEMDGSVLEEKSSHIICIAKVASKETGALIHSMRPCM